MSKIGHLFGTYYKLGIPKSNCYLFSIVHQWPISLLCYPQELQLTWYLLEQGHLFFKVFLTQTIQKLSIFWTSLKSCGYPEKDWTWSHLPIPSSCGVIKVFVLPESPIYCFFCITIGGEKDRPSIFCSLVELGFTFFQMFSLCLCSVGALNTSLFNKKAPSFLSHVIHS